MIFTHIALNGTCITVRNMLLIFEISPKSVFGNKFDRNISLDIVQQYNWYHKKAVEK